MPTDFRIELANAQRQLRPHCRRLTGNNDDARELCQKASEKALFSESGYRGGNMVAWVKKIATNEHLMEIRRYKTRKIVDIREAEGVQVFVDPIREMFLGEVASIARRRLPEAAANVFRQYTEGRTVAETARDTAKSRSNIYEINRTNAAIMRQNIRRDDIL